ncbi:hypothetical protein ACFSKU_19205 [Pontibacter silvestris]|uniref:ATP-binding protein n=1 Tax=Pontibacter silvestris TaxID=2305183 RepID=A0ABW4X497_9BACT|nr:hypothetical protein [Pontibacter silvestris]MCC9134980.1 hypothetical protein [Pontibacter silvestris]
MRNNYTPSINIIRDIDREVTYIPTPNTKRTVSQIIEDFRNGVRSFNLIGSYGTGKSSFLLALELSLKGTKPYFSVPFIKDQNFGTLKIVGSYKSIIETFANQLDITVDTDVTDNILTELVSFYKSLGSQPLLFIVIDEFGKLLEYAAQNKPERELYFIQQLAELANDTKYNFVLITTIHQSFESYGYALSDSQRQEWTKVKGRFRDVTFNEPVEQLLYLASEHITEARKTNTNQNSLTHSFDLFLESKAFSYNEGFSKELNSKVYPLDLISANVLTLALQRYGQNERSLFSFLESTDHTSLAHHRTAQDPFYNLANVYDYLHFNFYSYLTSRFNDDFAAWASIKSSLEIVERELTTDLAAYIKLIKAIGLVNVFAASGAVLDRNFWTSYASLSLGIPNADDLLKNLETKKIIFFRNYSQRYILFEGTDLDIQAAMKEAVGKVSDIKNIKSALEKYISLPPVLAKAESYKKGTPRAFEFVISDSPIDTQPKGEVDGFINLIFNESLSIDELQKVSESQKEAILYAYYQNSADIKKLLLDIEKSKKVLEDNEGDRVAKRELSGIIEHQKKLLNHYLVDNLYSKSSDIIWYWGGQKVRRNSKKLFNSLLSDICEEVYKKAPIFKNELVNKHKVSTAIHSAKKNLFEALVQHHNNIDLAFAPGKFPPEKTIYITLLKVNGLEIGGEEISIAAESSFKGVWDHSLSFLEEAKKEKTNLKRFAEGLGRRPFKLKEGLISVWIPVFLFLKRHDFALFGKDGYIPELTEQTLELISKDPQDYWIKAFDLEGVKLDLFNSYRVLLNQETREIFSNQAFIETIKPFLVFYRQLPEYSKNTNRLTKEALAIREAIIKSKDPEETFFVAFPAALGVSTQQLQENASSLNQYVPKLQEAITELRTSYDRLLNRIEEYIQSEIIGDSLSFIEYKEQLQKRFKKLKKHMLVGYQKTFVQRLGSEIDERKAWLESLCQAIIGKPLDTISDKEEMQLYNKFGSLILELDSLTEISKQDINDDKEEVLGIQFSTFVDGIKKSLVRLPKDKASEINEVKKTFEKSLSSDSRVNIAALAKLLKELIQNG